jgi:hypothetical protein
MKNSFQKEILVFLLIINTIIITQCGGHGLAPPTAITGFGGVIHFRNWPTSDSLDYLRLVAFRNYPPTDIINDVVFGRAYVFPPINDTTELAYRNNDSTNYKMILPAGIYQYIVVVQHYNSTLLDTFWRVVGLYSTVQDSTLPRTLEVKESVFIDSVNINVDFHKNLPQPF